MEKQREGAYGFAVSGGHSLKADEPLIDEVAGRFNGMKLYLPVFLAGFVLFACGFLCAQPLSESEVQAAAARVDLALLNARKQEGGAITEQPAPDRLRQADDAVFLRRACIDLAGRLPKAAEVRQFLEDPAPAKRGALVDRLLEEPGAAEVRFQLLAESLRVKDTLGNQSQAPFIAWLHKAMADDMPYDKLMATLLRSPNEDMEAHPASGFYTRDGGDLLHTSTETAEAFLGARLYCAQCHDHPYAEFTQRQTFEFAGCFADSFKNGPRLPSRYAYRDGKPGDWIAPRYLPLSADPGDEASVALAALPTPGKVPREELALWFTGPTNNRFAEVGALRLWHRLFGRINRSGQYWEGAVQAMPYHTAFTENNCEMPPAWKGAWPEDLLDPDNDSAGPVRSLGEEFMRCGYRQKEFMRILARTMAYQSEAVRRVQPGQPSLTDGPFLKRLPPEVTWTAWSVEAGSEGAASSTGADIGQVPPEGHPLRLLGRGTREWSDESAPVISHALTRFIITSSLVEQAAKVKARSVSKHESPTSKVEHLFLSTLGRFPEGREESAALRHLAEHPESAPQDIAWALLNTSEFLFQP
ncbi:uncharacterized protein DUF1549 [Prosthecobacter fusiformis]|uniref:Uncharacterized protein DUF1549 n=2 Tax=Prosthecobacter fusiformis TaxID=48464 RepID=A0A4R7S1F0_9BACT|nr:uncharacterized protein DUF1549 [Prosthecobacter fusiformis]